VEVRAGRRERRGGQKEACHQRSDGGGTGTAREVHASLPSQASKNSGSSHDSADVAPSLDVSSWQIANHDYPECMGCDPVWLTQKPRQRRLSPKVRAPKGAPQRRTLEEPSSSRRPARGDEPAPGGVSGRSRPWSGNGSSRYPTGCATGSPSTTPGVE